MWGTYDSEGFHQFWSSACGLPEVEAALKLSANLNLLPYDICLILRLFKRLLFDIIWRKKYNVLSPPFVGSKGDKVDQLKLGHLVRIIPIKEPNFMLDDFFCLTLDDESKFTIKFLEWKLLALFYQNESIYTNTGKEFCIALDAALGSSGCEAIVEGFYILVNFHKKSGGQSNDLLVQRVLVDWTLPHSISCLKTMKQIAIIYTDSDPKTSLIKHRLSTYFDKRELGWKKYKRRKAVDKLKINQLVSLLLLKQIYDAFIL